MLKTLTDAETTEACELCDRVKSFLQMQHLPALKKLEVAVDHDTVKIYGNLDTYYERQVAIECCKRVAGVRNVVDQIFVNPPAKGPTPTAQLNGPHRHRPR